MIELPIECAGQFRAVISKDKDCKVICHDTGFFKNLVLNNGLNLLCANGISVGGTFGAIAVGSGTTEPAVGQTALSNIVASRSLSAAASPLSVSSNYDLGYIQASFAVQFNQGAAAGNLSEFGVGQTATSLFSRALIVDAAGDPTTITVLSDEYLTVYYIFRINIPKSDIIQQISATIDGVPTPIEVTIRPLAANAVASSSQIYAGVTSSTNNGLRNGDLVLPTATLSPTIASTSIVDEAYVSGTFRRTGLMTFGTAVGVGTNNMIVTGFGPLRWQIRFNPSITKTNQQVLSFRFGYQMGRPA